MNESSYFGKQPNRTSYIKLFYGTNTGNNTWVNTKYDNSNVLAPINKKSNVYVYNNLIVGGSIINPSDSILKTNIEEISLNTANNLLDAKPKQYTFKKHDNNKIHYGCVQNNSNKLTNIQEGIINHYNNYKNGKPIKSKGPLLIQHYYDYGINENRKYKIIDLPEDFNHYIYKNLLYKNLLENHK
jgi:hypothetical protein